VKEKLNLVGLFAGVGGIEAGFVKADFNVVSANELDVYAARTYELNHEHKLVVGDIAELTASEASTDSQGLEHRIDVLAGGFPCQPFSVAGHRRGFDDDRGNVFWEIHRLISELNPRVVFLENVKNLLGHDGGRTYETIAQALEGKATSPKGLKLNSGYFVKSVVLNAKDFGVPQNRERIYILAFRDKQDYDAFEFPKNTSAQGSEPPALTDFIDFEAKVDGKYYYAPTSKIYDSLKSVVVRQDRVYQWRRQYVRENKAGLVPTLTANMGMGGHNVPIVLTSHGIRKLTPRECFRLMGFPDPVFPANMAESRLYKQAGNAVVVPVIEALAKALANALKP
jgi:DNA (cytosine-5)-methyltransferase 1